ncbi:MAG: hypothetical protein M3N98_04660 [Actinomycetota bacterium]|nr:hypothetical protein [Actinomycetota bacterium]
MKITAHGLSIEPPTGWDARIRKLSHDLEVIVTSLLWDLSAHPVLHAADFALPEERGDFGSGVVEHLRPWQAFLALVEYSPANAGTALFSSAGPPRQISADAFSPQQLQRTIRGQAGVQRFFSTQGRAFCLYVVIGSMANRLSAVHMVNDALRSIEIGPP